MRTLLVLFLVGLPALGWTAPPKLVVLEAIGPLPAAQLAGLTDKATGAVQAAWPDVQVMTRDTLEALLPPGVALADCDDECEADAGRRVGADWVLSLQIAGAAPPHVVTVTLIETHTRAVAGHGTVSPDGADLLGAVERATRLAVDQSRAQTVPTQARRAVDASPMEAPTDTPPDALARVLRVESSPLAEVILGDQNHGKTPVVLPVGDARRVQLTVRAPDHRTARLSVGLPPGSARLTVALQPALGRLDLLPLEAHPQLAGAQVEIDGLPVPRRPGVTLRHGRYRVRLKHPCGGPTVSIVITGQQTTPLPLAALLRCRPVQITSAHPQSKLMPPPSYADAPAQRLPQTVWVPPEGTIVRVRVADLEAQALKVPGDAQSPFALPEVEPGFTVRVRGRYRNGERCRGPLRIDGKARGRLPWRGRLTHGRHRLEARCRVPISVVRTITKDTQVDLNEPFGKMEASVAFVEFNAVRGGGRFWLDIDPLQTLPFVMGFGLHALVPLDDTPQVDIEVPLALRGRTLDWIFAPSVSSRGPAARLFARWRTGSMFIDFGGGVRTDFEGCTDAGFLLGVGTMR